MWLEINKLNVSNSSKIIFENANLQTDSKLLVIYGPNGIGKSTLFNAIYKYKGYDGSIRIFNSEVSNLSKRFISETISYVMQEPMLFPDLSVKANLIMLGVDLEVFNNYYKQFVLKGLLDKKFGSLSGGEKQAISLSIGFAKESKCLLLDEPFNNLSSNNKQVLINLLKNECRKIIIISHEELIGLDAEVVRIEGRGFNV